MSNPRIPITALKQIIQFQSSELTTREIARALHLSQGAVSKYRQAVRLAGISAEEAQNLEDAELERRVWQARTARPPRNVVLPDCAWIHTQMKRHKHVTLRLVWEEYRATHGSLALRYSAFCERYRQWAKRLQRSMRQRHYAGEKLFVDYAGRTVPIYGATCEEMFRAAIFVGALGASGYAYAEATRTASLPDWLGSHVRMLQFYGFAPTILVPDNPRVGVTKADRYEPELQRSYEEMAAHFSIAVIPARPFRPRDKPRAELTVLLVCRWVLARLRHQRFFSLEELNAAIKPLLAELNERPYQKIPGSRRSVFEALDRPAMRPLPATPYVYAEWKRVRAAFDYHVADRPPLLQCPARPRRPRTLGALRGGDRGGLPPQRAGGQPCALVSARRAHHVRRTHAEIASRTRRMVTGPAHSLGRIDRRKYLRGGRTSAEEQTPSRARLSRVLGALGPRSTVRARTTRGGERLGREITKPHAQERAVDLEDRAGPAPAGHP